MSGFNACWVPGTDHASIATEAKVVKLLESQGIKKSDITREEFLTHAWAWKDKYGGIILEQLKKLGASCDWNRTRFTMEDSLYNAVVDVFVDLYEKGLIYRGTRMVNWDPTGQTTLSDEEVIHKEVNGKIGLRANGDREWHRGLTKLIDSKRMREELGLALGEYVREKYDIKKINLIREQTI